MNSLWIILKKPSSVDILKSFLILLESFLTSFFPEDCFHSMYFVILLVASDIVAFACFIASESSLPTEFSFSFFRKSNSSQRGTIFFCSVFCLGATVVGDGLLSVIFFVVSKLICENIDGGKKETDVVQPSGDEDDNLGNVMFWLVIGIKGDVICTSPERKMFGFDGERNDIDGNSGVDEEDEIVGVVKALVNAVAGVKSVDDLEIWEIGVETVPENVSEWAPESVETIGDKRDWDDDEDDVEGMVLVDVSETLVPDILEIPGNVKGIGGGHSEVNESSSTSSISIGISHLISSLSIPNDSHEFLVPVNSKVGGLFAVAKERTNDPLEELPIEINKVS